MPVIASRRAALSGLLALAACTAVSEPSRQGVEERTARIQVTAQDWHTDIVLAATSLGAGMARLASAFSGARYLAFGFGDRAYLQRPEVDLFDMLAALLPGPGAVFVTPFFEPPARILGAANVVELAVSEAGRVRAEEFVWRSFASNADGTVQFIGPGPYAGSRLYASSLTYEAGMTCNTWTAQALRAAGLPIVVTGVLFTSQVMGQVRRIAAGG